MRKAGGGAAFGGEAPVEVACSLRLAQRGRDGLAVGEVVRVPALAAGPVPGGQADGVVEEEQRRPPAWPREPHPPAAERGAADDPQVAAVVADVAAVVVDEAAAVAGEAAPLRHGVQRAERVDAVRQRHAPIVAPARPRTERGTRVAAARPAVRGAGSRSGVRWSPFAPARDVAVRARA